MRPYDIEKGRPVTVPVMASTLLVLLAPTLFAAGCGGSRTSAGAEVEASAGAASTAAGSPEAEEAGRVRTLMETARIPGLSLAVIRDGEIARPEVFGVRSTESGRPVTEDTLFEAASLSKPVFAAIVLRMAERGELDLDRPLLDLIDYERLSHDPRARLLTARLVLSHRTGLPNWGGETLEFLRDPGDAFGYSGEGYVFLQRVIEAMTGLGLDELARREVFDPLGMASSRFTLPEGAAVELASPHDEAGRPQPKNQPVEANAAGSLHTTARDYARFVLAWLDGELLSGPMAAEALSPAVGIAPELSEPGAMDEGSRLAWGLGWGIQLSPGDTDDQSGAGRVYWHWGDNGPFKAFVAFDLADRSGLVYLANSSNGLAIAPALLAETFADLEPTFEWLDYERADSPGFAERLEGAAAEAEGRYAEAAAAFRMALVAAPEDEETQRRVEWLTELLDRQQRPLELPASLLERYTGTYGPRVLSLEDGSLHYQRGSGQRFRLLPLSDNLFALEGLVTFRLEVVTDARGEPVKLVGHYVNGETDESARDGD